VKAVGLSEPMKRAGFAQGGFYKHFEPKADLVAEVLASAITEGNDEFAKTARAPVDESTNAPFASGSTHLARNLVRAR
jgi:TetR/AcrR family transcriptional regulator, transcriptional repressor for nem operon